MKDNQEKELKSFEKFQVRWAEKIGQEQGCWYLTRWVVTVFGYAVRLHHWIGDDDQRNMHDHPWRYLTIVLRGGYTDISPSGEDHVKTGSVRLRQAEHKHTVRIDKGGCWTLLFTGPVSRHWGFWVPGRDKLLRPLRYFDRFGHHQCD